MYKVRHLPSGALLVDDLEIASTGAAKRKGLLGRDHLPFGGGMLFPGVWSIHTLNMRFAIDVLFLDKDLYVRRVIPAVPPTRMVSGFLASYCLELPAGARERVPIEPGDGLRIEKHVPRAEPAADAPALDPATDSPETGAHDE